MNKNSLTLTKSITRASRKRGHRTTTWHTPRSAATNTSRWRRSPAISVVSQHLMKQFTRSTTVRLSIKKVRMVSQFRGSSSIRQDKKGDGTRKPLVTGIYQGIKDQDLASFARSKIYRLWVVEVAVFNLWVVNGSVKAASFRCYAAIHRNRSNLMVGPLALWIQKRTSVQYSDKR